MTNPIYYVIILNNVYIKSKFIAERLILENISKGLDAQILRLGNITSRYKDGLFQINPDGCGLLIRWKPAVSK